MPKYISFPQLREHGMILSRRQLDRIEAAGDFPKRVNITAYRVGWVEAEVIAWSEKKVANRDMRPGLLGSHKG